MAGNAAIWRALSSGSEASAGSDIILFNEQPIPSNGKQITQTEFEMKVALALNEKPKQKGDEFQHMGFSTLRIFVTGSLKDPANNAAAALTKKWLIDDQTNSTFPIARFGLRLDDFPAFNLTPTTGVTGRGYLLEDWRWVREGEWKGRASFVATLVFNGNVGTSPFTW